MSSPVSGLVYREYGSPLPYGELRVYVVVEKTATGKWQIHLKRSLAAARLNVDSIAQQDMATVKSFLNPASTVRLEWIGSDVRDTSLVDITTLPPVDGNVSTPLTRLLDTSNRRRGYIALTTTAAVAAPMGFAVLSQVRWLQDKDIVTRMIMIASAAFVLVILLDGGARKNRTGGSFGNVEFIRSFYWAGAVGGLVVTGAAMRVAFAEAAYPNGRTAFRIVDSLSK